MENYKTEMYREVRKVLASIEGKLKTDVERYPVWITFDGEGRVFESAADIDAFVDQLDNWLVDSWHDSDTEMPLHEWMGMTREEYGAWVELRHA